VSIQTKPASAGLVTGMVYEQEGGLVVDTLQNSPKKTIDPMLLAINNLRL
jgi:hypothetical protein